MSSASTGGTEGSSPASSPASAASLAMAAPKYGTLVPNRIFVGGISASTSEAELAQLFSAYGNVKATKIISDRAGVSKGYGFVTFETEEEAKRLQQESECIVLRERKLNIAPAIKKQPFNRSFDGGSGSPPAVPTSTYYYTNGMSLTYQNGMTFYNAGAPAPGTAIAPPPTDPAALYQAAGVFGPQATTSHQTFAPVMYPCPAPSLYMPQQYQYSPMPYEPYYTGANATGAQYMYATSNSQNTSSGSGNGSGTNSNGTGATSPSAGPPPPLQSLPPPPPTHYYAAPAAAHHHAPVAAGPPAPQMDHLYYSFAGHPPPPPHAQIGLGDQQLLLYTTDTSCQQQTSESQGNQQEDSHSTSSHTEQQQSETQTTQPSGSSTPLVSLMPVKFPISGRYTNYHPLALHASNLHSSQNCLNETDDCNTNPMHCRTYVYHPAAVYIPHSHAPPPYHNTSGTSLLPTPPPPTTPQPFDYSQKPNFRDYSKGIVVNPQNYSPNSNYLMSSSSIHQNSFAKSPAAVSANPQIYKYTAEAMHKYQSLGIPSSRLSSGHHYKRNFGSNAGSSSSCFLSQKPGAYSPQTAHKSLPPTYSSPCTNKNFEYTNGRRNYNEHHADNVKSSSSSPYNTSSRKNASSYRANNATTDFDGLKNGPSNESSNFGSNRNLQSANSQTGNNNSSSSSSTETGITDKPTSPPPAPYSPMTRPLPTLSPPTPTSQVQFYSPAQNRFQQPPPMSHQHHQQQLQQSNQRRYAAPPPLRRAEKYSSSSSSAATCQNSVLRQPNKYKVNGIIQTGGGNSKVSEDSIGGAGDAPSAIGRIPLTPPGTPRNHSSDTNQLSDACHQMQALNI
ncbi:uncharacterized protein PB18E9.04c-like isoform X2 [Belonocnema kinseyi]|uniref:uncharacterized protein PB18E9.04c-like isoform X2 n=1 Tax=Belonocnema kinseyi TaxID=2817044 RepID=UPI00143D6C52|nr:uncharacterized protein PB18E9.04c-like isoform X2 [Belonocnema kinseyi]